MAPNGSSRSRQAQWQAARLPVRNPAAARISEPVQTEVRYVAPAASRRISAMKASSSIASVAPRPPGTQITSQRSIRGEVREAGEHQAFAGDVRAALRGDDDLGARRAAQHLVRAGEVEVGHVRIKRDHDPEPGRVGHGNTSFI